MQCKNPVSLCSCEIVEELFNHRMTWVERDLKNHLTLTKNDISV